jgi:hypothetical protein
VSDDERHPDYEEIQGFVTMREELLALVEASKRTGGQMMKIQRIIENADNESVMPWGGEGFVVGYVDEVNGTEAAEVSGFVPTRHELILLVEYWERKALETEWWWFTTGQVGSSETRLRAFAIRRVNRIYDLIGQEEVQQAIDRVYAEFGKHVDRRHWDIFLHGDSAARDAVQSEMYGPIDE